MDLVQKFVRRFWWAIALLVLIIVIGGAYALGFRVEPGGIARVGTLTLIDLPANTKVFIDQSLSATTKVSTYTTELVPGSHTIIVSAPNEYPWSSVISIKSGANTQIDPFLVQMNIALTPLTGSTKQAALSAIASSTLPSQAAPLKLQNGCALVYVRNNQVIEDAATSTPGCTPPTYLCIGGSCAPTIIFSPVTTLQGVYSFPGRQDALVVSFANSLYALSLDPTNPQFFAPLVRGQHPQFGQLPDGSIIVSEGSTVSKLNL